MKIPNYEKYINSEICLQFLSLVTYKLFFIYLVAYKIIPTFMYYVINGCHHQKKNHHQKKLLCIIFTVRKCNKNESCILFWAKEET